MASSETGFATGASHNANVRRRNVPGSDKAVAGIPEIVVDGKKAIPKVGEPLCSWILGAYCCLNTLLRYQLSGGVRVAVRLTLTIGRNHPLLTFSMSGSF